MFTMKSENARKAAATVAAIAIVSAAGLAIDRAHLAAAPRGTVEIGELTPARTTLASLPEVVVVAKREPASRLTAAQLPEVVVVAKRPGQTVAERDRKPARAPAISAGF